MVEINNFILLSIFLIIFSSAGVSKISPSIINNEHFEIIIFSEKELWKSILKCKFSLSSFNEWLNCSVPKQIVLSLMSC